MEVEKNIKQPLIVHFHGNFIPLQGTGFIVEAAAVLKHRVDIKFRMIGGGQTHADTVEYGQKLGLSNMEFISKVSLDDVAQYLRESDISLGIFGKTDKALRVIPNKLYEAIAVKKPVITADTPAIRELFINGENIALCRRADGKDLARVIAELADDELKRKKIAENGYRLFEEKLSPAIIAKELLSDLAKHGVLKL